MEKRERVVASHRRWRSDWRQPDEWHRDPRAGSAGQVSRAELRWLLRLFFKTRLSPSSRPIRREEAFLGLFCAWRPPGRRLERSCRRWRKLFDTLQEDTITQEIMRQITTITQSYKSVQFVMGFVITFLKTGNFILCVNVIHTSDFLIMWFKKRNL